MQHHNARPSAYIASAVIPRAQVRSTMRGVLLLKVVPRAAAFIVSVLIYVAQSGCRNVTTASRVAVRILIIDIPRLVYDK